LLVAHGFKLTGENDLPLSDNEIMAQAERLSSPPDLVVGKEKPKTSKSGLTEKEADSDKEESKEEAKKVEGQEDEIKDEPIDQGIPAFQSRPVLPAEEGEKMKCAILKFTSRQDVFKYLVKAKEK
jgi:hypothetical protein